MPLEFLSIGLADGQRRSPLPRPWKRFIQTLRNAWLLLERWQGKRGRALLHTFRKLRIGLRVKWNRATNRPAMSCSTSLSAHHVHIDRQLRFGLRPLENSIPVARYLSHLMSADTVRCAPRG